MTDSEMAGNAAEMADYSGFRGQYRDILHDKKIHEEMRSVRKDILCDGRLGVQD